MKRNTILRDHYGEVRMPWLVAAFIACAVMVFVGPVIIGWRLDLASCERQAERLETDWLHDAWGEGCFLQMPDGRFVPAGRYRTVVEGGQS